MLTVLSILVALAGVELLSAVVPTVQRLVSVTRRTGIWPRISAFFVLSGVLGILEGKTQSVVWGQWAQRVLDPNTRFQAIINMIGACVAGAIMYRLVLVAFGSRREPVAVMPAGRLYRPVVPPAGPNKIV